MPKIVVISAGHGGIDGGANGIGGINEATFNLQISLAIEKYINPNDIKIIQTRTTDVFFNYADVGNFAHNNNADLVVSPHCNSGGGTGYEICVKTNAVRSTQFANAWLNANNSGLVNRGIKFRDDLGVLNACTNFNIPSAIVEYGFMDNLTDYDYIQHNIDKLAEMTANAIYAYFGIARTQAITTASQAIDRLITKGLKLTNPNLWKQADSQYSTFTAEQVKALLVKVANM